MTPLYIRALVEGVLLYADGVIDGGNAQSKDLLDITALTGARKQSISYAEYLFSALVISFMERKVYTKEEQYLYKRGAVPIHMVLNWRRAL